MRRFRFVHLAILGAAILLTGCASGSHPPACLPEAMSIPVIDEPGGGPYTIGEPYPNPPAFNWLDSGECIPDEYRVIISRIPYMPYGDFEYLDSTVWDIRVPYNSHGPVIVYPDGSTAYSSSWAPSAAFAPGVYYWRVISYSGSVHGEPSEWAPFRIGPYCRPVEEYRQAPELMYPRNGQFVTSYPTVFLWFDDNPCLLYGDYLLNVSTSPDFPSEETIVSHGTPWTHHSLYLQACTRYYWKVQVNFGEGIPAPVTEVRYFDMIYPDGSGCTPAIPTTAIPPLAIVREPANCRSGPSVEHPVVRVLQQGEQYPVVGRSQDGLTWVIGLVAIDDDVTWTPEEIRENGCWVHTDLVEVLGDTSLVEMIDPMPPDSSLPPTPTIPPVNCAQYNSDHVACNINPACKWDPNSSPNSPCVNR